MDTVLLVTGAAEAATARLRTVPVLSARYRVLPVHVGWPGDRSPAGDVAQLADELAALLDVAGLTGVHAYGVSFGGMVAQQLVLRHPDRVRSLVLAATSAGGTAHVAPDALARGFLERRAAMPLSERVWASVPYEYVLATRRSAADRIGQDVAERLRLALDLDDRAERAAADAHDAAAQLTAVAAPTLVLHGAEDVLVPPANGRALADAIPGAEHCEVAGAAHHYATDAPGADKHVLRFLAASSGSRRRRAGSGRAARA
jgi:pimeloyl-ACP methyl ester carboxylesterase